MPRPKQRSKRSTLMRKARRHHRAKRRKISRPAYQKPQKVSRGYGGGPKVDYGDGALYGDESDYAYEEGCGGIDGYDNGYRGCGSTTHCYDQLGYPLVSCTKSCPPPPYYRPYGGIPFGPGAPLSPYVGGPYGFPGYGGYPPPAFGPPGVPGVGPFPPGLPYPQGTPMPAIYPDSCNPYPPANVNRCRMVCD